MINAKIKEGIEIFLVTLHASESNLLSAMGCVSNRGLRIDIENIQSDLRALIAKTEDVIYPPENETEIYRYTTDDKPVRFVEE